MDLEQCTKTELIQIILDVGKCNAHAVRIAVEDVAFRRKMVLMNKISAKRDEATDFRINAIKLLGRFAGQKYSDIPLKELEQIRSLHEAADTLEAEADKLQKKLERMA